MLLNQLDTLRPFRFVVDQIDPGDYKAPNLDKVLSTMLQTVELCCYKAWNIENVETKRVKLNVKKLVDYIKVNDLIGVLNQDQCELISFYDYLDTIHDTSLFKLRLKSPIVKFGAYQGHVPALEYFKVLGMLNALNNYRTRFPQKSNISEDFKLPVKNKVIKSFLSEMNHLFQHSGNYDVDLENVFQPNMVNIFLNFIIVHNVLSCDINKYIYPSLEDKSLVLAVVFLGKGRLYSKHLKLFRDMKKHWLFKNHAFFQ